MLITLKNLPGLKICPFLYKENKYVQKFKERPYVINWDPQ